MNTRLKIICILFGIIYFYIVCASIIDIIPNSTSSLKEGFKEGYKKGYNFDKKYDYDSKGVETVFFYAKPEAGYHSFPSSVTNLKTGNLIQTENKYFYAKIDTSQASKWIKIGRIIFVLTGIPLFFVLIFIPIQIYRVISSIVKNDIFNPQNIKRIRRIGYCLLYIFAVIIFGNFLFTFQARELIEMENYRVIFKIDEEYYYLLFALVTLMFAEILKISHSMKEEQDLTI